MFIPCCIVWSAAVLHVQTRLLWVSSGSGDPVQAGGDGDGSVCS